MAVTIIVFLYCGVPIMIRPLINNINKPCCINIYGTQESPIWGSITVREIVRLADHFQHEELRRDALRKILTNPLKALKAPPAWALKP